MFPGAYILRRVREEKPLIHHLTNFVTMNDCAAVTANMGALPVMAQAEEEVEEMVALSRAAVINTGTLTPSRARAARLMGKKAREADIPVVFDPVGAGSTSYRTREVKALLAETKPAFIKGNAAEIGLLTGSKEAEISGVHTVDAAANPLEQAKRLKDLLNYDVVVAVTGTVDIVTDGRRLARIFNGHHLLPQVVGSGCMAASVMACFAAVEDDRFLAAAAALACVGVAAQQAAQMLKSTPFGPALFKLHFIDAFFLLTPEVFDEGARVEMANL